MGELNAWLRTGLANAGSAAGPRPTTDAVVLAADADRDRAVDALRSAFIEGSLTEDEFGIHGDRALAARTRGEVVALLSGPPATRHCSPTRSQAQELAARRPFGYSLLLWALGELAWAATLALRHRWPSSIAVHAVLLAGVLAITAGTVRCAWRVMAGY